MTATIRTACTRAARPATAGILRAASGRLLALLSVGVLCATPAAAQDDEPWTLFPSSESGLSAGGWVSAGFHSASNDLFNSDPERLNLHQAWLYAEQSAARDDGSLGFGFRFDFMYGTDAGDTQAFGNSVDADGNTRYWDNSFQYDHGYGIALPQAYVEVAKDNWSVIAGHFYTLIGYEVVTAPDNFFYSHAITMYNSEPFTHTGALASIGVGGGDTTIYAGYTLGWDTGFDRFESGSNFLGGVGTPLGDKVTFTYITTIGDFGARGGDAYSHSLLFDVALSDELNWVIQSDYLNVGTTEETNVGLNQYLFYTLSDTIALGTRFEWWRGDDVTGYAPHGGMSRGPDEDHFAWTFGTNVGIASGFTLRPEIRINWSGEDAADYNRTVGAMDLVVTF